ncbi:MAG: hypothetical protein HWQ41_00250 [Nostoc sp. NOS(2021)]|uniref:hypothetical protein n=1 Tax=Nostoc sp. NOS(2021) TaxID=2815407 RepID=UPI0025F7741C|nr:hypothetical protein [Nostoc sp. NOS(2021)]MBN3893779.1 hypothetical protein [Nostoc sp. NOS(2021)]
MHIINFYQALLNHKIPILVDSEQIASYFREQGYKTIFFDDYDFATKQTVFVVISDYYYHDRLIQISHTSESSLIHLLAVRYDTNPQVIAYSFEQLLSCNITQALELRAKAYEQIAEVENELYLFDDRGSKLKCFLSENLEVINTADELEPGWFYSISEILESGIVNIQSNKSSFSVDGTYFFDGIIYACANLQVRERNQDFLTYLLEKVASSQEKYINIEDNSIMRLVLDGRDETSILLDMDYGLERNLSFTEIGFGCNTRIAKNLNWQINSIMNQGVHGMHIGIGMAQKSPYIDFISQSIKL